MHFRRLTVLLAMLTLSLTPMIALAQDGAPASSESGIAQFDPEDFASLDAWPGDQFTDVPVETASGTRIGTVRVVGLAPDGSAARVRVDLYSGGSVWIVANALRYNRNARILLTNLKHIEPSAQRNSF